MTTTQADRLQTARDDGPELLTVKQAAALCGCGERTWWRWTRSGLAPRPVQIGHGRRPACRWPKQNLLDWISRGCPRTDDD